MSSGFFIAGTDTAVGKTLLSCALLHAFQMSGKSAVGMKPVAAGCEANGPTLSCDDVHLLQQASSVAAPPNLICQYAFEPPIAPHLAAAQQGRHIEISPILASYRQLSQLADVVIVEGVGGFRVPLNANEDTADLARQLGLPVILVVGLRLGCISHTLLTAQSIAATGLPFAGWIANQIDETMLLPEENIQALSERLTAPLLGHIPFHPERRPDLLAPLINLAIFAG